jgi:hypothetical protein
MTAYRLASGGLVDRRAPLDFRFDGRSLTGFLGDTLASALLANDQLLVGRSFKYHRPRGIVTAGASEPNALMTIGKGASSDPNTKATVAELYSGLDAHSQNRFPSLKHDFGAVNGLLSPFLGAGFYYKTFMWPAVFWEKVYEPIIRKAAGLGRAVLERDPQAYEKCWAHCDLLVVGSGPTGLMAALTAGRAGLRVILADEDFRLGGSLLAETVRVDGASAGFCRNGTRRTPVPAERDDDAAHHRFRLVRRQRVWRGRAGAEACGLAAGEAAGRAALAHRCKAGAAGDRCRRTAAGFRRQ